MADAEIVEELRAPPRLRKLTVDEYYRMAAAGILEPEERVELIEGVVFSMVPQNEPHANAIVELNAYLVKALAGPNEVRVQLPLTLNDESEPEPDFAVVRAGRRTPRHRRTGHPSTAVLVIEIADSTLKFDREKAALYARAGVKEYWIVNVRGRCVEVFQKPNRASGRYKSSSVVGPGQILKPAGLPGPRIPVEHLFPSRRH
jgi:Uma2 family endonuclease